MRCRASHRRRARSSPSIRIEPEGSPPLSPAQSGPKVLSVVGLRKEFGQAVAVDGVSFDVGAAHLALSPAELAALDAALPPGKVAGPRYDEERMRTVDR